MDDTQKAVTIEHWRVLFEIDAIVDRDVGTGLFISEIVGQSFLWNATAVWCQGVLRRQPSRLYQSIRYFMNQFANDGDGKTVSDILL